jgi:hypothetical protein
MIQGGRFDGSVTGVVGGDGEARNVHLTRQ